MALWPYPGLPVPSSANNLVSFSNNPNLICALRKAPKIYHESLITSCRDLECCAQLTTDLRDDYQLSTTRVAASCCPNCSFLNLAGRQHVVQQKASASSSRAVVHLNTPYLARPEVLLLQHERELRLISNLSASSGITRHHRMAAARVVTRLVPVCI